MKFRSVVLLVLLIVVAASVAFSQRTGTPHALTGQEILLEIECPENPARSGIYTLDPLKDGQPKLWLAGAHRPVWSRDRTVMAYEYDDFIYIMKMNETKNIIVASLNYTARNYNHPLLIINENQGLIYQQTVSPEIKRDMVCGWWEIEKLEPLANGSDTQDMRGLWLFRPLPGFTRFQPDDVMHKHSAIKVGRSVSFAPGEQEAAVAESVLAPFGSCNDHSKVMIYSIGSPGYVYKEGILAEGDIKDKKLNDAEPLGTIPAAVFSGENCRRLTRLSDTIAEMNPVWSPDGKWIAFTVYNPSSRRSDVLVCRPGDSSPVNLTKHMTSSGPYAPGGPSFLSLEDAGKDVRASFPYGDLGVNDVRAVEWSQDSKSLLLVRGFDIEAYAFAKVDASGWQISQWKNEQGMSPDNRSGCRRVCFGPINDSETLYSCFKQGGNGSQHIEVRSLSKDRALMIHYISQDMRVLWMDW